MKIAVFADLHYFGGDLETALFNKSRKLVQFALPLLERFSEMLREEKVDFCINLGDLIQDDNDKQKDIDCLKMLFEKLENLPCPCYSVFGNHDLKMMETVEEVEAIMGGRSTHSLDAGGYHFVFLTTEVRPELGLARGGCYKAQYLSDDTLVWLENDLAKNTLPCILFTHYGLAEDAEIEDECMFMANRAEVKEIIKNDKNIVAVFSGHQHRTKQHEEDGIPYYLLGSMTARGDAKGVPCGVYFDLTLENGGVQVETKYLSL